MHQHRRPARRVALGSIACAALASACASSPPKPWTVPAGWKHEAIPFPLDFAPALGHRGVEELRFAPGFFDASAPGYWSYVFAWRLEDAADLDEPHVEGELQAYFRGLIAAVDDKQEIPEADREQIQVRAKKSQGGFELEARVFDAFGTPHKEVDLSGRATRTACKGGSLWVVVVYPSASTMSQQLYDLAREAACGQPVVPNEPKKK
jgi:hypothetical protein